MTDRSDIYYLFFDTETAGLPYDFSASTSRTGNWPRLVQLSWIAQDRHGNTISEGNYIIRPDGFEIPYEASDVHGITTEMALEEGTDLRTVLDEFMLDAYEARYLVCHNAAFDINVLGCEFYRIFGEDKIRWKPAICTMLASTEWCDLPGAYGPKWPKLQELHEILFGYEFDDAHDSSADVAATARCYWELREIGVIGE